MPPELKFTPAPMKMELLALAEMVVVELLSVMFPVATSTRFPGTKVRSLMARSPVL